VTVAIGALSGGIAVIWDTGISSIVLFFNILFPDVLDTKWDRDHRKLSMLTGWRAKSVAIKQTKNKMIETFHKGLTNGLIHSLEFLRSVFLSAFKIP
jgi:hypothetical protein